MTRFDLFTTKFIQLKKRVIGTDCLGLVYLSTSIALILTTVSSTSFSAVSATFAAADLNSDSPASAGMTQCVNMYC